MVSVESTSSIKLMNSSPPTRATVSASRMQASSLRLMAIKSWSPIW